MPAGMKASAPFSFDWISVELGDYDKRLVEGFKPIGEFHGVELHDPRSGHKIHQRKLICIMRRERARPDQPHA